MKNLFVNTILAVMFFSNISLADSNFQSGHIVVNKKIMKVSYEVSQSEHTGFLKLESSSTNKRFYEVSSVNAEELIFQSKESAEIISVMIGDRLKNALANIDEIINESRSKNSRTEIKKNCTNKSKALVFLINLKSYESSIACLN